MNIKDIFIIGGGINGVGIAADAAGRGLTVTLCEKHDLGSATSSASSKLIHGGLRYLTTYDFRLVRKALIEREILLKKAPHLIRPLKFILPHDRHLRSRWLIRLGLFIYDHLASHPHLPNSKQIQLKKTPYKNLLNSQFTTGFSYYDCYDDDARLVITNAMAAYELGAIILPRTTFVSAHYKSVVWEIKTKNILTNEYENHFAKVLINAAGPWIQSVNENITTNRLENVELIKGSHIIVKKLYDGDFAFILQNKDERIVFAIPYENDFTLIGTTDVPLKNNLESIECSEEEKKYLCNIINYYFNQSISLNDILFSYAGVRCLQHDAAEKPADISRDYKFQLDKELNLLTVISGKITTYRKLSEEIVNSLQIFFPKMKSAWTTNAILPGGDFPNANFKQFYDSLCLSYAWLPKNILYRYAKAYGTRTHLLLNDVNSIKDLGLHFGNGLYETEIDYLIKNEWAQTSEDILWRRTKLGLFFNASQIKELEDFLLKSKVPVRN